MGQPTEVGHTSGDAILRFYGMICWGERGTAVYGDEDTNEPAGRKDPSARFEGNAADLPLA